jgi:hypothetical protein
VLYTLQLLNRRATLLWNVKNIHERKGKERKGKEEEGHDKIKKGTTARKQRIHREEFYLLGYNAVESAEVKQHFEEAYRLQLQG